MDCLDEEYGEFEYHYGGTRTDVKTLPIGTEFFVCNGHWDGKIERIEGTLCITNGGEPIVNLDKYNNYILYIDDVK